MSDIYSRAGMEAHPPSLFEPYRSTILRAPKKPLIIVPQTLTEITGPVYGHDSVLLEEADLTAQHNGEPQGERIIVSGRVSDENGRPVPDTLIEVWQANAGGRYIHERDQHPAHLLTPILRARGASSQTLMAATVSPPSSRGRIRGATITMRGGQRIFISRCLVRHS